MWYPTQTKESEFHDATRKTVKERHPWNKIITWYVRMWTRFVCHRTETNGGLLKHGNESLGSFKGLVNFVTS
jgi:hypothetical protein